MLGVALIWVQHILECKSIYYEHKSKKCKSEIENSFIKETLTCKIKLQRCNKKGSVALGKTN